jgi:hypothetical protein
MTDLVVDGEIQILTEIADDQVVVDEVEVIEVLTVAEQGPEGRQGPPGLAGASYLTYLADGALGGQRVVRATTPGKVGYVDPSNPTQAHAAIGITVGAAADGESVNVQFSGEMSEPSWAWTANLPIFAGANGVPTQTPPTSGFQVPLGVATSATAMVIQIKSPIVL